MTESDAVVDNPNQKIVDSVSSSQFDKLTDELLIETVIRLPLKPANLCKCISRRFRSLISRSYFIHSYMNYHKSDKFFALYHQLLPSSSNLTRPDLMSINIAFESNIFKSPGFSLSFLDSYEQQEKECIAFESKIFESPGFSLSFLDSYEQQEKESLQILGSDNGLVLCCANQRQPIVYFVCNPLTKQWVALPPPPSNVKTVYVGFICKPQFSHGDDNEGGASEMGKKTSFKVVRIEVECETPSRLSHTLKLEIFCSVSGRWTEEHFMSGDYRPFHRWNFRCPSAVVCEGLLHWDRLSIRGIFTYDPYKGECRTIELPNQIKKPVWGSRHCLGVCRGRLRYANFSWDDTSYRVWELKDYSNGNGGEWLLFHKVHRDEMQPMVQNINKDTMGVLLPHPLNQDVYFFWCRSSHRIVEYNMRNKLLQLPCFVLDNSITSLFSYMLFSFVLPCWPTTVPLIQQHDPNL